MIHPDFFKQVGARNVKPAYLVDGTTSCPWDLNACFLTNACVYPTAGTFSGWAGIGTW